MNDRLRMAVRNIEPPPYLEARVRNRIRASRKPVMWGPRFVVAAAALVVCFGVTAAYQPGHLRFNAASQESYVTAMYSRLAAFEKAPKPHSIGLRIRCRPKAGSLANSIRT
jgi:hypothetical protein